MDSSIVNSLISGGVTAFVAILGFIGTMYVQKKKDLELHTQASEAFKNSIEDKLDAHREEYLERINAVECQVRVNNDNMVDLKSQSEHWQDLMELKFENLSEKVTKHNNVVERITKAELNIAVLQNRGKVSEHRLDDLEAHEEN